ncbi:hypothetical protein KR222_011062, partial [Zaprionus bogoriensis]
SFTMASSFWFCFSAVLLFLLAVGKPEERNFRIIIEEFVPKAVGTDLFEEIYCNLTQIDSRSYLNCNFRLKRVVEEIQMDSSLDLLRPNKQAVRLYNVHFDACQYLSTVHKNVLFNLFTKSLKTAFNDSVKCPLMTHYNYTLTNWSIDENNLPSYVPKCNVKALTKFFIQKKVVLTLSLKGRVVFNK